MCTMRGGRLERRRRAEGGGAGADDVAVKSVGVKLTRP